MRVDVHWLAAGLLAIVAGALTDWLFFGWWMRARRGAHPEIWRQAASRAGAGQAIGGGTLLGALPPALFVALCAAFHVIALPDTLTLALGVWLVGPVPLLLSETLAIKLDPLLLLPHGLGWLARLAVAALAVSWLLA